MRGWKFSRWLTSRRRVAFVAAIGTLACIIVAFAIDSYSISQGRWMWGEDPWKNVIIPLVLAPPVFYGLLTMVRQLSIAHDRLEIVASTDSLTSCLNRAAFATLVDAYLEKFSGTPRNHGALLIVDVDHFKKINDTLGHDVGDEALKMIASTIRGALRDIDLVGRLGGEEFSVFLPGAHADQCAEIAERIRVAVQRSDFRPNGDRWLLSVSIGAAPFAAATTFSELYRVADQHLYDAKRKGRNRVAVAAPLDGTAAQRVH